MPYADSYTCDVHARFDDFVGPGVQWQRGLWDIGLVVSLRELREASDAVAGGVLSARSVKWLASWVDARTAQDPGAGDGQALSRLRALLKADLTSGGGNHAELAEWIGDVQQHYLTRWRASIDDENRPSRERAARALTEHLIGEGFSSPFLRSWLRDLARKEPVGMVDIVDEAIFLVQAPTRRFEVLVPFDKPPERRLQQPAAWMDAGAVKLWLSRHGFEAIRQHGGLLLDIEARDHYGAASAAGALVDRLRARVAVGSRDGPSVLPVSYVQGHSVPLPQHVDRRAEVRALDRENALMQLDEGGPIDQALELLSHVNTSPDAVAAAAGWSAVESLLSAPGDEDKVITADRLADLVACSWPRAELTTIAWARIYQTKGRPDALADELLGLTANREKADRVLAAIEDGEDLELRRPAETLALSRMTSLVRAPRDELLAVQRRAAASLRRLYRHRNLVVHGGQTAGPALATALRVAAPLLGAGLDRITHADLVDGRQPLELAARARFEIHRAGSAHAPSLTGLLE